MTRRSARVQRDRAVAALYNSRSGSALPLSNRRLLMRPSGRLASILFASCSLAFLTQIPHAQGIKLNGPLARPVGGDIREFQVSPDGTRVIYAADQDTNDVVELYSA